MLYYLRMTGFLVFRSLVFRSALKGPGRPMAKVSLQSQISAVETALKANPYLDQCSHIVSVGRVKWIADTPHTGKDNCAWYRFDCDHSGGPRFVGQRLQVAA